MKKISILLISLAFVFSLLQTDGLGMTYTRNIDKKIVVGGKMSGSEQIDDLLCMSGLAEYYTESIAGKPSFIDYETVRVEKMQSSTFINGWVIKINPFKVVIDYFFLLAISRAVET